jgi:hypothetical protein
METTPSRTRGRKRIATAALVIGASTAVLASPLAVGTAAAATTTVAIVPAGTTSTMPHGGTATINYTIATDNGTKSAPATTLAFVSGPDAVTPNPTVNCNDGAPVGNVYTGSCTFTNIYAGAGSDTVQVTSGGQSSATTAIALTGPETTPTSVTIDTGSQNQNVAQNGTATINVHYSPAPPAGQDAPLLYITTAGGNPAVDGTPFPNGTVCKTKLDGTGTCTLSNSSHAMTVDTVEVFADLNNDAKATGGEPNATTNVTFTGPPANVTINAASGTAPTGSCVVYTINAFDSATHPAAGQPIDVAVSETVNGAAPTNPVVTFFNGSCSPASAEARSGFTGTGPYSISQSKTVTTDSNGQAKIGIAVGNQGSGQVTATYAPTPTVFGQQAMTWTAGGADAVLHLSASPTTRTQYVNTTASFTVHATDTNNNPVQGVLVSRQTSATTGPDHLGPSSCGVTDASGNVKCTVPNGGAAGTDPVTFWVDNGLAGGHTGGPDANEPQATATAIFNAQPAFTTSTLTCVQQLAGASQGTGVPNCTVPTSQKSVTFTETLKNGGSPVPGAVVDFSTIAATLGGTGVAAADRPSATATTDANGTARFTIDNPSPANNDAVVVTATVGAVSAGTAGATWKTPVAAALSLTPPVQSVQKGGTVGVVAQVTDQFGKGVAVSHTLNYTVSGRNSKASSVATNAAGSAVISYVDAGLTPLVTTDTIHVADTASPFSGDASVQYINGPATASSVVVDTSNNGTTDGTCNAAGHTARTDVTLGTTTTVCVTVKNAQGEVLAGKSVVFTVSNGQVAKVGALTPTSSNSTTVTTDASGNAFVDVTSTKSGVQTVSAIADSVTGTNTVTYQTPPPASARNIKIAPTPATIAPGGTQKFTATVTDAYGNPVPSVTVVFTQSGPGSIGSSSSMTLTTGTDGTAAVTVTTGSADTGSGSVVASLNSVAGGTQCGALANGGTPPAATPGNCTATATYTVSEQVSPVALSVQAFGKHRVGSQELIAATVTNSDGTPAVNQLVRFRVAGANSASGSGVTTPKGVAFFAYTPKHGGTDRVTAYDDVDNDGVRSLEEPNDSLGLPIKGGSKEKPTIRLTTKNGHVTVHVTSHPRLRHAKVTYYLRQLGRFHAVATNHTGAAGHAHKSFTAKVGKTLRFRVKIAGKGGVRSGTSKAKSITVSD